MKTKKHERRPFDLSEETGTNRNKMQCVRKGETDTELKETRQAITRSTRKDKRQHQATIISSDLDIRDRFIGQRNLRRAFTAVSLGMQDENGQHM